MRHSARGYSSVGRAFEWHSKGQEFDSPYLHHKGIIVFRGRSHGCAPPLRRLRSPGQRRPRTAAGTLTQRSRPGGAVGRRIPDGAVRMAVSERAVCAVILMACQPGRTTMRKSENPCQNDLQRSKTKKPQIFACIRGGRFDILRAIPQGGIAQLVERLNGIQKVRSSTLLTSTIKE